MSPDFLQRTDRVARNLAPLALTIMLVVTSVVPVPLPHWDEIAPALPLMGVFYWGVHRPDLMSAPAAFGIGLFEDLITGTPIGFNALVLVIALRASLTWRRYVLSGAFMALWWGYAAVAAGIMLLQWVLMSLWYVALLPVDPIVMRFLVSLAVFPVCAWVLMRAQRAFL